MASPVTVASEVQSSEPATPLIPASPLGSIVERQEEEEDEMVMSDAPPFPSPSVPPSAPLTPVTPARSSRKRRLSSGRPDASLVDEEERGEAEGAVLGSDSKRRREELAMRGRAGSSSNAATTRALYMCADFTRGGQCARGLLCLNAHIHGAAAFPSMLGAVAPANRPGATSPHSQSSRAVSPSGGMTLLSPQHSQPLARSLSMQQRGTARPAAIQRTASFSGGGSTGGVPSSPLSTAIAAASCKLCVSLIPASHFTVAAVTQRFAEFGSVSSVTLMPPDRAVVQFETHTAALAAFLCDPLRLGDVAVKRQWIVPRRDSNGGGTNGGTSATLPSEKTSSTILSTRSGKAITVVRRLRPPQMQQQAQSHSQAQSPSSLASAALFIAHQRSASVPLLSRPVAASAVAHYQPAALPVVTPASPLSVSGSGLASPTPHPHAHLPHSSLLTLLTMTEGMLARISGVANSESMQHSLQAKVTALREEVNRRGGHNHSSSNSSSSISSANSLVGAVAPPSPLSSATPLSGASCPSPSPSRSPLPLPLPVSSPVVDQLRQQRESVLRLQAAQSRAAHSKQRLDEEMDDMRKAAQLATIVETDTA